MQPTCKNLRDHKKRQEPSTFLPYLRGVGPLICVIAGDPLVNKLHSFVIRTL